MIGVENRTIGIFVDQSCPEHWIIRDPEGNFWILPPVENAWDNRESFSPTEETQLEPVPGHYRSLLDLPFESWQLQS